MAKKKGGRKISSIRETSPGFGFLERITIGGVIRLIFLVMMIFVLISFMGLFAAVFFGALPTGNIAVIPITGTITSGSGGGFSTLASSSQIVEWIKNADENKKIKAILLDINSGGGSAVGSDEIAQAVKNAEKPVVAVIREAGASGAYWIASSADKIYANRMSITGSIGVVGSYLEIDGLLNDYNITYRRLVAGKYKDMGSPMKEMTSDEEAYMQMAIDEIHRFFIDAVAQNRNMPADKVAELATGRFMIGVEAYDLGLVDELGSKEDAVKYLEKELNITADLAQYRKKPSLYESISAFSEKKITISLDKGSIMQT